MTGSSVMLRKKVWTFLVTRDRWDSRSNTGPSCKNEQNLELSFVISMLRHRSHNAAQNPWHQMYSLHQQKKSNRILCVPGRPCPARTACLAVQSVCWAPGPPCPHPPPPPAAAPPRPSARPPAPHHACPSLLLHCTGLPRWRPGCLYTEDCSHQCESDFSRVRNLGNHRICLTAV